MDKQKEIEKMAFSVCKVQNEYESITSCEKCGYTGICRNQEYAEEFIKKGYGDVRVAVKNTAQDIFSWIYKNLVNLNFITGNVEINLSALNDFAKTYGVDVFDIFKQGGNKC